jgi:hypothetical protein
MQRLTPRGKHTTLIQRRPNHLNCIASERQYGARASGVSAAAAASLRRLNPTLTRMDTGKPKIGTDQATTTGGTLPSDLDKFRQNENMSVVGIPPNLRKDCMLFYCPETEELARKVAALGEGNVHLGEVKWK